MSDLKALRTLMTSISTDWMTLKKKWERDTMLKVARTGRKLSFICYACVMCAIIFYIFVNLLKFYRSIQYSQRLLIYQFNYPYGIQKTPNYVITHFIQLLGGLYGATINTTVDTFISLLLLHICAQLIILRMTLNELVEKLAKKSISFTKFKEGLTAIVLRHKDLIKYVEEITKYNLTL